MRLCSSHCLYVNGLCSNTAVCDCWSAGMTAGNGLGDSSFHEGHMPVVNLSRGLLRGYMCA